ncbi:DMT family transporter [Anaerotignum sp.]|uniref:DMT family transporter n=1 Tax=Anaerotignum sp. TaxID=2039241 RepID=UPI0028AB1153|nr:DMT family transporter [Anaerotignum sp.]
MKKRGAEKSMNDKKKAFLADCALVLAAICWGGGFIAGDIAVQHFSTFYILATRFLAAAIIMFIFFGRIIRRCGKAEIKSGLILGTLFFLVMPLQVIALKYTTPSKQAFLLAGYAAMVPFISWIVLKNRPKINAFIAGVLVMIGIGLISLNGSLSMELGDSLSLGFSFSYAVFVVLTGIFAGKCNPIGMSFFSYLSTGVFSLIVALLFEDVPTVFPPAGVMSLAYLAIINTAVAYTLQNVAQKYTTDTHTAILLSTESLFAFIFGVCFYGDPFTPQILIGGLIVFSAVIISEIKWKKRPKETAEVESCPPQTQQKN